MKSLKARHDADARTRAVRRQRKAYAICGQPARDPESENTVGELFKSDEIEIGAAYYLADCVVDAGLI